jgi:hypothetical protein
VTPARLVTGLISQRGVIAPTRKGLAARFPEQGMQGGQRRPTHRGFGTTSFRLCPRAVRRCSCVQAARPDSVGKGGTVAMHRSKSLDRLYPPYVPRAFPSLYREIVCDFPAFFLLRRGGHSTGLDIPPSWPCSREISKSSPASHRSKLTSKPDNSCAA